MDGKSLDITQERLNKLKEILPDAFTEGKIDWEKLQASLGENIEFKNERYVLNWAGKSDAFRVLQSPTTATLVPCKEESVDFNDTENIFIEGENLEVLKVLQKSYFGKIKMTYIDPPYNTGNDKFIYPDKFSESRDEYLSRIGDRDETGYMTREGLFRTNSKDSGHYHSNWLSMMYPRLFLARNLLREDGVIFVSIDEHESPNLQLLMNEIFGEENLISIISMVNNLKGRNDKANIAQCHEYVLIYSKGAFESYGLPLTEEQKETFKYDDEKGNKYALRDLRKRGRPDKREDRPNMYFPIYYNQENKSFSLEQQTPNDVPIYPKRGDGSDGRWRWGKIRVEKNLKILTAKYLKNKERWGIQHRVYLNPSVAPDFDLENDEEEDIDDIEFERTSKPKSFWWGGELSTDVARREFKELFVYGSDDYTKSPYFIERLLNLATKSDDIILDFFAGSGTTAQSIMQLNKENQESRKYILVQIPEQSPDNSDAYKNGYKNIAEICKERIRRVIKKIKAEQKNKLDVYDTTIKQDLGFKVFKLQESNFKIWRSDVKTEEELYTQLTLHTDPVDENAKIENILYELLLKSGVPLTARIEEKDGYYCVNNGEIIMVLKRMDESIIKMVISEKPKKLITLDRLFKGNDQLKTNTALQLKDSEIDFRVV